MRLALDIGNSRIKWGLRQQHQWIEHGTLPTAHWDRLGVLLEEQRSVTEVWACQVAGPAVASGIAGCCAAAGVPLRWIEAESSAGGVTNRYENPEQLGADRWAALVGARAAAAAPAVVVNAGTATTVDALGSTGEFLGGMILPGLTLMQQVLHQGTAALPASPAGRFSPLPRNTADAIVTGAIAATAGAVERVLRNLQALESREVRILLSGGHADMLREHLGSPVTLVPHLVLEGIAHLMDENQARSGCVPARP